MTPIGKTPASAVRRSSRLAARTPGGPAATPLPAVVEQPAVAASPADVEMSCTPLAAAPEPAVDVEMGSTPEPAMADTPVPAAPEQQQQQHEEQAAAPEDADPESPIAFQLPAEAIAAAVSPVLLPQPAQAATPTVLLPEVASADAVPVTPLAIEVR